MDMPRWKRKQFDRLPLFILFFVMIASLGALFLPNFTKKEFAVGCGGLVDDAMLSAGYDFEATMGEFEGKIIALPPYQPTFLANVLGETTDTNKRIEVDLANQKTFAYEGDNLIYSFTISSGKWFPTPTGIFTIERKVTSQTMKGGNKAKNTYYYLPNVPNVMYFGNSDIPWWRGFSFHGTYWHNNFGQPMSHGCVNMKTEDSKTLFDWSPNGTKVYIH